MNVLEHLRSRRNEITLVIIIASIIGGVFTYGYSQSNISNQSANYTTYANVTPSGENISIGIEAGEGMQYGRMIKGSNITKSLKVSSGNETLTFAEISTQGNISDYLHYNGRHLFRNNTDIKVKMEGRNSGYYTGDIFLDIKTASNMWGETWLEIIYRLP